MKLPTVPMDRIVEHGSLAQTLDQVQFDADAFDANRQQVAAQFCTAMEGLGIEVADSCKALAVLSR